MPLIIEGSDNLGKSTAAKRIVELAKDVIPAYYTHMSRQGEAFDYHHHYKLMATPFAVQDRFHIGAYAWHDPWPIKSKDLGSIQRYLEFQGSFTVVFATELHGTYEERLINAQRDEMFNVSQIMTGNHRFLECHYAGYNVDVFWDTLRFGFPDDKVLMEWILQWISRLDKKGWLTHGPNSKSVASILMQLREDGTGRQDTEVS